MVLYELLVGALPLEIKALRKIALGEVLRAIRENAGSQADGKNHSNGSGGSGARPPARYRSQPTQTGLVRRSRLHRK